MSKSWGTAVEKGNAPFKFGPEDSSAFFSPLGWREAEFHSMMLEARRLRREMRMMWFWRILGALMPAKRKAKMVRMSGSPLLERA